MYGYCIFYAHATIINYTTTATTYADDTKYFIAVKANQRDLGNYVNHIEDCLMEEIFIRHWIGVHSPYVCDQ